MKIKDVIIENYSKPEVIGEIGINHGGSLMVAKDMVDSLKRTGINLVKHQTHIIDQEYSKAAKQTVPGNSDESIYDIMSKCSLNEKDEKDLADYVRNKGLIFLSTPFSLQALYRLLEIGIDVIKIGSGECNNHPFLQKVGNEKLPVILSTGMNSLESVRISVDILISSGCPDICLMHTTNLYPTPDRLVRLGAFKELMETFCEFPVGLSDHTLDNLASIAAIAKGASLIERHYTDTYRRQGPDIINSMDEAQAINLMQSIDRLELMKGGTKVAASEEQVTMDFAFSSVVSIQEIKQDEIFTEDNIWVKRPGIGELPATSFNDLLGKKAACDIPNDFLIQKKQVIW